MFKSENDIEYNHSVITTFKCYKEFSFASNSSFFLSFLHDTDKKLSDKIFCTR